MYMNLKKTFQKKRGTAIGSKFAPRYAILYMADIDEKLLVIFETKNNHLVEVYRLHIFLLGTW